MKKIALLGFIIISLTACANQLPATDQSSRDDGKKPTDQTSQAQLTITEDQPEIILDDLKGGETVASPLKVTGKALGNWFFEGTLPVQIENTQGELIGMAPARALDDWQQAGYVRFEAEVPFDPGTETRGALIIKNDNPSGLRENDKALKIPVFFGPSANIAPITKVQPVNPTVPPPNQITQPIPTLSLVTTADISAAFAKKYPDWNMADMDITIATDQGDHASGGIKEKGSMAGGGYWFAANTDDGWIIASDGNGSILCADIDPYNFPTDMIEECYNEATGVVVNRTE